MLLSRAAAHQASLPLRPNDGSQPDSATWPSSAARYADTLRAASAPYAPGWCACFQVMC